MKNLKKAFLIMMILTLLASVSACGKAVKSDPPADAVKQSAPAQKETGSTESFPTFTGKDFQGNTVDSSLFGKNEATLLNFWFNDCSACVNEMPALEKLNARLREKGAELVGVNVQAGESQEAFDAAKEILSKQGVTFRNIIVDNSQEAGAYIAKIFSFPTSILVDRNGSIVGQPILGSIEDEERMNEILGMVDGIKSSKGVPAPAVSENQTDEKTESLLAEINNSFTVHKEVWDKLFASIAEENDTESEKNISSDYLKEQIEKVKDSFSEEELRILNDELKKIAEIERQMANPNTGK